MMAGAGASPYELASDAASRLGIAVGAEELATLASDLDLGDGEMAAVAATFSYLAEKRRLASIETLLRLSRLPSVSVNIIFTISTNAFSPIAPTRIRRIRQRGCAAFGA